MDARDAEIARLTARLEEASGASPLTPAGGLGEGGGGKQGAKAANARIIAQLHQQVDFLSKELSGREEEVKALRARETAGGRDACRALQVRVMNRANQSSPPSLA